MNDVTDISKVAAVVSQVQADMTEVKSSIKSIAEALTKLAVLDDRQLSHFKLLEKQLIRTEALEEKHHRMELQIASLLNGLEAQKRMQEDVDRLKSKVEANDVQKATIGLGAKAIWTMIGGVVTGLMTYLVTRGGV